MEQLKNESSRQYEYMEENEKNGFRKSLENWEGSSHAM